MVEDESEGTLLNEIKECIDIFDNRIASAHAKISNTISAIYKADESIRIMVDVFRNKIDSISIDKSTIYSKEIENILQLYKSNSKKWCDTIDSLIQGKDFISQFEKSVLVVVFGNVNVGKSSVGNLIAGVIDPDSENADLFERDKSALKYYFGNEPDFYEYDIADNSEEIGAKKKERSLFKEGYTETTSTIQYFTRNDGLTWTDSPGICSVNRQNGALAKKYVEFADLVIFITSSSSPAKNDEVQELKKLFNKKKPLLILINKSDVSEKDEIDGKIVRTLKPKLESDRKKQEEYIKKMFEDEAGEIITEVTAISISRNLALEGLRENDFLKFKQSGFQMFFQILGNVFDDSAVEMKMSAPKNRINSLIDEIITGGSMGGYEIEGITQYRFSIEEMRKKISDTKMRLKEIPEMINTTAVNDVMNSAIDLIHEEARKVRNGGKENELSSVINSTMVACIQSHVIKEVKKILSDYNKEIRLPFNDYALSSIKIKPKIETVTRTEYDVKSVKRNPDGLIEHIEAFVFKKEFTRYKVYERTVTESFVNGDNSNEVLNSLRSIVEKNILALSDRFVQLVIHEYFDKEDAILYSIKTMLDEFEEKLRKEYIR